MASSMRRRMPSARPPVPSSLRSCRTVFKSSGLLGWVILILGQERGLMVLSYFSSARYSLNSKIGDRASLLPLRQVQVAEPDVAVAHGVVVVVLQFYEDGRGMGLVNGGTAPAYAAADAVGAADQFG